MVENYLNNSLKQTIQETSYDWQHIATLKAILMMPYTSGFASIVSTWWLFQPIIKHNSHHHETLQNTNQYMVATPPPATDHLPQQSSTPNTVTARTKQQDKNSLKSDGVLP